jgi:hypothetical protein
LVYELVLKSVLYPAPTVTLEIGFGVSVTVDYALVLDSKGVREAVQEKNPIKALNSFAFRDTFDGVDKPLVVFEIKVTASVSVSAVIVKIGVSGGITITIEFDFYDPNPATSGGLIRPFELFSISPNPLDWFEVTINAYVTISFYVQVGIFLGLFDIILYEYRVSFNIVIIDSLKITPQLKCRVATKDQSGRIALATPCEPDAITCKHIDGGSGDETVQCWTPEKEYPIIGYFEQVSSLVAQEEMTLTINCIESAFDISMIEEVILDYNQCTIFSDEGLTIGGKLVSATQGPITIRNLRSGTIYLPTPAQDFLSVTIFQGCNAFWTLYGDSALNVMASQVESACMVEARGGTKESVLTVDLTSTGDGQYCVNKEVAIDLLPGVGEPRGMVKINDVVKVKFNSAIYTDIVIEDHTLDCDNTIHVMELSQRVKSVLIKTYGGNDTIVIGSANRPFEDVIHGSIDVDGGDGLDDKIIVHDGSTQQKNQTLSPTLISGIQAKTNETATFFYKNIERMELNLGQYVNAEVAATVDLTIRYNNSNSNDIHSTSLDGVLNIKSIGHSRETITIGNSKGNVNIDLGSGDHVIDVSNSIGDVNIQISGGNNNMTVYNVDGDLSIVCQHAGNDNDVSVHNVLGDSSIVCEDTGVGTHVIDISNNTGTLSILTLGGENDISVYIVGGDLTIECNSTENDRIEVDLAHEDQTIATNSGNDTIIIHSVHDRTMLTINAGESGTSRLHDDHNYIEIDGLFAASAMIIGGHGNDFITVNNLTSSEDFSTSALFNRERSLFASYSLFNISTGKGDDSLYFKTTPACTMQIDTGDDNDVIQFYGLGLGSNATVLGGSGNDTLKIDGRGGQYALDKNTMDRTSLNWNGGGDEDRLEAFFVSAGNTNLNLFGDSDGPNYVTLNCADIACIVLSRDTFLANM